MNRTPHPEKPVFEARQFLADHFTNAAGVVAFVRIYTHDAPSEAAVEKWFSRETVPAGWLPLLLAYLELDRGGPVSLKRYLRGPSIDSESISR